MLDLEGYHYKYESDGKQPGRWNCAKRRTYACPAFLITNPLEDDEEGEEIVGVVGVHTHRKENKNPRAVSLLGEPIKKENKSRNPNSLQSSTLSTTTKPLQKEILSPPKHGGIAGDQVQLIGEFVPNHVYLLITNNARELVCVNGFMYRLEGVSSSGSIFRWECIRSDVTCKTRIFTKRVDRNCHILINRENQEPVQHQQHKPYTPEHLSKLVAKHNMHLVSDGNLVARATPKLEGSSTKCSPTINTAKSFTSIEAKSTKNTTDSSTATSIAPIKISSTGTTKSSSSTISLPTSAAKSSPASTSPLLKTKTIEITSTSKSLASYEAKPIKTSPAGTSKSATLLVAKSMKSSPPETPATNVSLTPDNTMKLQKTAQLQSKAAETSSKSVLANKHFFVMPSAKGHRVICIDNMVYNYSRASPHASYSYWSCLTLRDQHYRCKARLVMAEINGSLQIRKMSGEHNHPDHSLKIDRRLKALGLPRESIESGTELVAPKSKSTTPKPGNQKSDDEDANDIQSRKPIQDELQKNIKTNTNEEQSLDTLERIDFPAAQSDDEFDFMPETNENSTDDDGDDEEAASDSDDLPLSKSLAVKRKHSTDEIETGSNKYKMDITKVSRLRSSKGHILLCIDDFIYYLKRKSNAKNHWECVKNRDSELQCKSFVTTVNKRQGAEIEVVRVKNEHNHPVCEQDLKLKLCNELISSGAVPKQSFQLKAYLRKPLDEIKKACAQILSNASEGIVQEGEIRKIKLYAAAYGPTSLAVRLTLKALNIPYELKNVDAAEQLSDWFAEMNPQKETPVLDDDGFYLPESIAIMHYLCYKYAPESYLYPKDAKTRALIDHRLCFNMSSYYVSVSKHVIEPIFDDNARDEMSAKRVKNSLNVFEAFFERDGTKYAAGELVSLADFALVATTICLEAIAFNLKPWPLVKSWYETFKKEHTQLFEIAKSGMQELFKYEKNPLDPSPEQPTKKLKILPKRKKSVPARLSEN